MVFAKEKGQPNLHSMGMMLGGQQPCQSCPCKPSTTPRALGGEARRKTHRRLSKERIVYVAKGG